MFISHKYKVIFIHIQKVGGSSIQQLFEQFDPDLITKIVIDPIKNRPKHCFAIDIKEVIGNDLYQEYIKFCVIRNPFDRLVSWYWMLRKHSFQEENPDVIETEGDKINFALMDEIKKNAHDFDEFIRLPRHHECGLFDRFFFNQLDYISDGSSIIVDEVLRFENLGEDFAILAEKLGLKSQLPHLNKTPRNSDYRTYYSETTQQLVTERFQRDLDYFNYKF